MLIGGGMLSERKCHGWRRMRSSENEVVGRRGASGDGAHLVGGGRDLRRQLTVDSVEIAWG